jgi:U3 small nucleolar RNA-associated protein 24
MPSVSKNFSFVHSYPIERLYRYSLHYGLRDGRAREARAEISNSVTVCTLSALTDSRSEFPLSRRVARDPRFERLSCTHKGTYADDCLIERITSHKCYIVATCDKELRRRVRKVPGVPLMYIVRRKYAIERLPDGGAPV